MNRDVYVELRERWALTVPWLARQTGIRTQVLGEAEEGKQPVPPKAAELVSQIDKHIQGTVDQALQEILTIMGKYTERASKPPIHLVTYPDDEVLWHYRPDTKPLTSATHAAMMVYLQMMLERHRAPVRRVTLDPDEYEKWRGERPDNEATRGEWAASKFTQSERYND